MRLLFIADGRSPIAQNWISYFIKNGEEVHLLSSYLSKPLPGITSFDILPIALSQIQGETGQTAKGSIVRKLIPVGLRSRIRQWLGPVTLPKAASKLRRMMREIRPDLIHAMRIPYEGMLAAQAIHHEGIGSVAEVKCPFVVSVWGNDFTLHARSTRWMAEYTRQTLRQADALHTDCQRDQQLAFQWGFDPVKSAIVLPGGGGIRTDVFNSGGSDVRERCPVVINPRGFRAYVRNDTFFRAINGVLEHLPETRFLCPTMLGEVQAHKWIAEYRLEGSIELSPWQTPQQMAEQYRQAQVVVSLTMHDGTPNTLLEALACGCFPVVGELESLREWITHGVNGLLVDANDPQATAQAIVLALSDLELRSRAARINQQMIQERAEYQLVMQKARNFYHSLIK